MTDLTFMCPHCYGTVIINEAEINCGIFRHATFRETGECIHPHATQEQCELLIHEGKIFGCGQPFKLEKNIENGWSISICGFDT